MKGVFYEMQGVTAVSAIARQTQTMALQGTALAGKASIPPRMLKAGKLTGPLSTLAAPHEFYQDSKHSGSYT